MSGPYDTWGNPRLRGEIKRDFSAPETTAVIADLRGVYNDLTPSAIETADIDGLAFKVKSAINALEKLHAFALTAADEAARQITVMADEDVLRTSTAEEIDAAMGLARNVAAVSERADIIAYLRNGGEDVRGVWVTWDSEMRGYAAAFAEKIEDQDHKRPSVEVAA